MRIGVDLGGTKIELIALGDDGAELLRRRVPTPAGNYEVTLDTIAGLVTTAERELAQECSVGIAMPGAISPATGLVKNSNSTVLNGRSLDDDLARLLDRPVRLENDANCFVLSEAIDGAAAQAGVVFGVILGTGVGGGIVVDKKLITGRNRIAGEWGHNPLPWVEAGGQPRACYCGNANCIETFLSGPAVAREYRGRTGRNLTAQEIVAAAAAGDDAAAECLNIYKVRLAQSLATVVNIADPDVIVLGGGLSNIAQLYVDLPRLVADYAFSDSIDTPILPPVYGDSSGVRGAAWLWPPA